MEWSNIAIGIGIGTSTLPPANDTNPTNVNVGLSREGPDTSNVYQSEPIDTPIENEVNDIEQPQQPITEIIDDEYSDTRESVHTSIDTSPTFFDSDDSPRQHGRSMAHNSFNDIENNYIKDHRNNNYYYEEHRQSPQHLHSQPNTNIFSFSEFPLLDRNHHTSRNHQSRNKSQQHQQHKQYPHQQQQTYRQSGRWSTSIFFPTNSKEFQFSPNTNTRIEYHQPPTPMKIISFNTKSPHESNDIIHIS